MTSELTDRRDQVDRLTHLTAEAYNAPCPPKLTHDFRCALGDAEARGERRGRKSQRAANEVLLKIRAEFGEVEAEWSAEVQRIYRWLGAAKSGKIIRKQHGYK